MTVMRVLLADDQRDVLTALELLFKSQGFSTRSVTSPDAILTAVREHRIDAVLMDLNYTRGTTTGEEGLELLEALSSEPNAPPVIIMTAWGSIELAVEAMRRGARDFVVKPWDNQDLVETVRRHARKPSDTDGDRRSPTDEQEVAARVQRKLWPAAGATLPTLEIAGYCRPVGAIGGDTYDFIDLRDGRLAILLADVSGKGLPAALMMASLQALLRSGSRQGVADLTDFLQVANRHFYESTEIQHYATLFFALYDDATRMLRYVSCGHPPALLLASGGGATRLPPTSTAFGLFESLTPEVAAHPLSPGDSLVVFSDGVTEASRPNGDELGETELREIVCGLASLPTPEVPQAVVEDIVERRSYRQSDDMSVVFARAL